MIGKIAIIGAILIIGGILLYTQLDKLSDNPTVSAVAENLDGLKDTTVNRLNHEIDKTKDTVEAKATNLVQNSDQINPIKKLEDIVSTNQVYYGQVYEKNKSENSCLVFVPKMAKTINGIKELTHTITIPGCTYEKFEPVQITILTDPITNTEIIPTGLIPQTKVYETLHITTTRNNDNTISLHYEDSSKKILKATVTVRNSEQQLFSGEFFTSKFDTNINNVSGSPHVIEMIVEHQEYGKIDTLTFNPQGNYETINYGVYTIN